MLEADYREYQFGEFKTTIGKDSVGGIEKGMEEKNVRDQDTQVWEADVYE